MCVCQYACAFLSCVCIFTCAYLFFRCCACMRTVILGLFHCFSPLYFRVHSCFLRYQKGRRTIFMRSLSARHSRMVAQGQFLAEFPEKWSDFFVWIRPGTLVLCSFVGLSAFLPCANGKISSKILKKGFFLAFLSRFERNKNPRKSPEKSLKKRQAQAKKWLFFGKIGLF